MKTITITALFILLSISFTRANTLEDELCYSYDEYGLSAQQMYNYINIQNGEIRIIDIRNNQRFKSGHIKNAILIDFYSDNFTYALYQLNKDKIYFVYDDNDNNSLTTVLMMNKLNFISVFFLQKGLKGWRKERYPLHYE